jgi:hypothetical protein
MSWLVGAAEIVTHGCYFRGASWNIQDNSVVSTCLVLKDLGQPYVLFFRQAQLS